MARLCFPALLCMALLCAPACSGSPGRPRKLLDSASAEAVATALGAGDAQAAAQAITASSGNATAVAGALAEAITAGQGGAAASAVVQAASQGAATQALALAISKATPSSAAQALNAVQATDVQAEDETCKSLVELALDSLASNETETAARITAAAFVQGGNCVAPLAAGLTGAADPMGCAPLLSVVAEAYKLSSEAGQGQPFMAALVAQPALLDRVRDCLSDEHPDAAGAEGLSAAISSPAASPALAANP